MKVLILRCKKAKFIYAWNGNREVSWIKKEKVLGSRYECCASVSVGSYGSAPMWIFSSNHRLALHTLVPGKVFAIRCASGSGVCRLEGPRCWAQAGMSTGSCQNFCVFHSPSCTRDHSWLCSSTCSQVLAWAIIFSKFKHWLKLWLSHIQTSFLLGGPCTSKGTVSVPGQFLFPLKVHCSFFSSRYRRGYQTAVLYLYL